MVRTPDHRDSRAVRRILAYCLVLAGPAMIPWVITLGRELPDHTQVAHWSLAWVGLDTMEALGFLTTGLLLLAGRELLGRLTAAVPGTLLSVDAWFDTTTAVTATERLSADVLAATLELPIAALCFFVAVRWHRVGRAARAVIPAPLTADLTAGLTATCAPPVSTPLDGDPRTTTR